MKTKPHVRSFVVLNKKRAGYYGHSKAILIFRCAGTWAFYDGTGFLCCLRSGFTSPLAATRAASKWLGRWFKLTKHIDSPKCSPRPPASWIKSHKEPKA